MDGDHPSEEDLLLLVAGQASESQRQAIHAHVDQCAACFELLAALGRQDDWSVSGDSGDPGMSRLMQQAADLDPGRELDRFVLLEMVGRGAMGTVYATYDRQLDRKVALKVLHGQSRVDSDGRKQLLREARALGKISHPHVVPVHEVGELDDRLYVVMEFVQGQALRTWLDEARSVDQIVDAFRQAGEGLQAAHAAGVIHRDFKPDNVLIGQDGRVRVVDFGLARAMSREPVVLGSSKQETAVSLEASQVCQTETGAVCGTPAYMAPEQWLGASVDGRADQFAWCVALYEALCGERPFSGSTPEQLQRSILANRVRSPPARTRVPPKLLRLLHRGLAPEPEQRWASMEPLLAELGRIMAPRRGRWLVLGVTAGLITIGAGLVYRAEVARQAEQSRQAELAKRCTGAWALLGGIWDDDRRAAVKHAFLETKVPYAEQNWSRIEARLDDYAEGWADKHTDVCKATSVRQEQSDEVLDLRMGCLQRRRNALTEAVGILAEATPSRVENASDLVANLPSLMRCDDIEALQAQWPPPEDPETSERVDAEHQQLDRAYALQLAGEFEEGERVARGVIERAEGLSHPPLMANALFHHANLVSRMGKYDDARKELEQAHLLATEHGPPGLAARAAGSLAYLLSSDQAESERGGWWGQLAVASSRALPGDPIAEAEALAGLGSVARSEGNLDRALEIQRQILEIERRAPGNHDSRISTSLMNIGVLLLEMGKYDESLESLRKALALDNELRGAEHPLNATTRYTIAMVLEGKGHLEEALEEHERVLALRERSLRTDHPDIGFSLNSMGTTLLLLGRLDDALASYERALKIWTKELGAEHPAIAAVMTNMGVVLRDQGEFERSQAMTEKALAIRETVLGPEHPEVAFSVLNLGRVRWDQGDAESALAHYRRAVAIWEAAHGRDYTSLAHPLMGMGTVLRSQGKLDEARGHLERALSIQERALGADHPNVAVSLLGLAEIAILRRQWDAARRDAERAVEITEGTSEPVGLADARFVLARAQWPDESLRPRARTLAQQAEATYADSGPGRAKALAKVRTWLDEHE